MYEADADPYCYPGTTVLKNLPGLKSQSALDDFEAVSTTQRADEPVPAGRLSVTHYKALHHHLFQDVYPFAGKYRTVRLGKSGSAFCYPEHIDREMRALFAALRINSYLQNTSATAFAEAAARFLATLNAIHPFREGNGRTQTLFLVLLSHRAGHPLDLERLDPEAFLAAMVRSFEGDTRLLAEQIRRMMGGLGFSADKK